MPLGNPIRKQNESRMVSVLATEGQTVFTVQGGYIINHISVFRNGVRLSPAEDFTAGDGSTVTLNNAANIDDRIDFHIFDRFTVQNAIVGAASSQTISGDLVVNGKIFGNLDVPSVNTGIVTATELDLNGNGDISGNLTVGGSVGIADSIFHIGNSGAAIRFPADNTFTIETGGSESVRITSGGDLGLGINNPAANLAIHETSSSSASSQLMRITTANGALFGIETDETVSNPTWKIGGVVNSGAAEPLAFYQIGSEKFRLDLNGRFLIGDATARAQDGGNNAQLQVSSAAGSNWARISSASFTSGDNIGGGLILTKSRSGTVGSHTVVQNGDKLGSIFFEGSDGTDYERAAHIEAFVDGAPGDNDMPGRLVFSTSSDGSTNPTERLNIKSNGSVNIGLNPAQSTGTNTTNAILTVKGYPTSEASAAILALIRGYNTTSAAAGHTLGRIVFGDKQAGEYAFIEGEAEANGAVGDTPGRLVFSTTADGAATSTERLRINSTGQLLLGHTASIGFGRNFETSSTSGYGGIAINRFSADTGSGGLDFVKSRNASLGGNTIVQSGDNLGAITWRGADGTDFATPAAQIKVAVDGTPGANDMPGRIMFYTTADGASSVTERLRIDSSGQMGLGMTPTRMFEVKDSTGANRIANIRGTGASGAYLAFLDQNTTDDSKCRVGSSGGNNLVMRGDTVQFATGAGTEFGRFDSSGRMLIGATSTLNAFTDSVQIFKADSTAAVTIKRASDNAYAPYVNFIKSRGTSQGSATVLQDGDIMGYIRFSGTDGTDTAESAVIQATVDATPGNNDMPGRLSFSTTADGAAGSTERLRISSNGSITNYLGADNTTAVTLRNNGTTGGHALKLTTGGTGAGTHTFSVFRNNQSSEAEVFRIDGSGDKFMDSTFNKTANNARKSYFTISGQLIMGRNAHESYLVFQDVSNNQIGNIVRGAGSSVAYNTSSDYRLKENVVAISDGITRLKTLKPSRFNFKSDSSITLDGFLAHEVTAVPEAITGTKDEVDSDNNPVYQGIDQSKLVPLLTAALQEAVAKIETLETKVAALEGS